MSGDSSTPLAKKLGIAEGGTLVLLEAPGEFDLDPPAGVTVRRAARGPADVVLAFFREQSRLERRLDHLAALVFPAGGLWIAWPKRSSGLSTTITDDSVRALALAGSLVDNKVCAIDATWTALRLVWRRSARPNARTAAKATSLTARGRGARSS